MQAPWQDTQGETERKQCRDLCRPHGRTHKVRQKGDNVQIYLDRAHKVRQKGDNVGIYYIFHEREAKVRQKGDNIGIYASPMTGHTRWDGKQTMLGSIIYPMRGKPKWDRNEKYTACIAGNTYWRSKGIIQRSGQACWQKIQGETEKINGKEHARQHNGRKNRNETV